jgi:hypothetical protein
LVWVIWKAPVASRFAQQWFRQDNGDAEEKIKGKVKVAVQDQCDGRLPCHAPVSLQSYLAPNQKPESKQAKKRP